MINTVQRPPSPDVLMERLNNLGVQVEQFRKETNLKLDRLDSDVSRNYVTRDEFGPVKHIVYGFSSLIMLAFGGLLIYVVGWHK